MKLSEPPTNIDYLKSKIQRGDDQAMFLLGNNYFYGGNGLKVDRIKARKWYERAKDRGNTDAMNSLGLIYKRGKDVERDYYKAANLFLAAAKKGNAYAQYNLANMYMMHDGVGPDYKAATVWYLESAKQGNASSQFSLGAAYENGYGVEPDYKESEKWYLKAAEQGHQYAQSNLSNLRQRYIKKDTGVNIIEMHNPPESDEAFRLGADKIRETVALIKGIGAAVFTYRNMYNALPGDMANAEKRIPNCKPEKCGSGNYDGIVGGYEFKKVMPYKDERYLFWSHLQKTALLGGYDPDSEEFEWGRALPRSALNGGVHVYSYNGAGKLPQTFEPSNARKGLYLILTDDINGDFSSPNSHFLTAGQAARLDRALDDGMPLTGAVIAAGNKECLEKHNGNLFYKLVEKNEKQEQCLSLFIRIQ